MNTSRAACFALFYMLLFGLGATARAQQTSPPPRGIAGLHKNSFPSSMGGSIAETNMSATMTAEHGKRLQNEVTTQSAHLLALAHKLNADLDKSNSSELSVAVVKDAAEIEKLAKSIRKNARDLHNLQTK